MPTSRSTASSSRIRTYLYRQSGWLRTSRCGCWREGWVQDAGNEATAARVTSKGLLLCPLVGLPGPQMRLRWYARDVMEYSSVVGLDTRLGSVPPLLCDLHPRLLALFLSAIDRYRALATLWSIRTRWTRIPSKIGLVSPGTVFFNLQTTPWTISLDQLHLRT
jgi:hypothetical protein